MGLAFEAGRVLCAGSPLSVVGGDAVRGLVRAGLQGVQAGGPVVGLVLWCEWFCVRRCRYGGMDLRIHVGFRKVPVVLQPRDDRCCLGVGGFGLCRVLRRPGLARGDRGLVLTLDGPVHGVEIGVEPAPPSGHFVSRFLCRLGVASSSQLGLGLGCASLTVLVRPDHAS